eukprot:SAG31_NODE_7401_length_1699_cov_1.209375_2_plen_274_part_00
MNGRTPRTADVRSIIYMAVGLRPEVLLVVLVAAATTAAHRSTDDDGRHRRRQPPLPAPRGLVSPGVGSVPQPSLLIRRPLATDDEAKTATIKVVLTQYKLANVSAASPPLKSGSADGRAVAVARVERELGELQQPIAMPSSTWKCDVSNTTATAAGSNGTTVSLRCRLLKGLFNRTNVTVSLLSTHRGYEGPSSYLAAPSALWDGRRFNYVYPSSYMGAVPAPFWTPQGPPSKGGAGGPGAPAVCGNIWGQPPLSNNENLTHGQPWSTGQMEW